MAAYPSARLSVRMEQLGSQWTEFHEIWYFSIFIENLTTKFKFDEHLT
jgi:hypothetical protein